MLKIWRFWIFLKIGSKDFFDILPSIRGHNCAHFAENRMFGKISVPELCTEKTKKWGIFKCLYLKNEKSYRKSDAIFRILGPYPIKNVIIRFSVSRPPFTLKIEPERWDRKKSQFWFFYFLEFSCLDFLKIEDNEGLL